MGFTDEGAAERLRAAGLRVESDPRSHKLGDKVREHSAGKGVLACREADW